MKVLLENILGENDPTVEAFIITKIFEKGGISPMKSITFKHR
jgi:hypothetical protein